MAYVVAFVGGFFFGAADQYLGTIRFDAWAWTVSGMSAPWLVLPFVVGMTQDRQRRAMALGLVVTAAALAGYFAMAHSPMEGAPIADFPSRVLRMITTGYNPLWIVSGAVTGPLYGYLGHRWHVDRSWVGAALVTGALCFEPVARSVVGMLSPHPFVWWVEVAVGVTCGLWFAGVTLASRRAHRA